MFTWFRRRRKTHVSSEWLKSQERQHGARVEAHGVRIAFPIKKIMNDAGKFNASRLRKKSG